MRYLLIFLLLSGCITQNKCLRKFPPQLTTKTDTFYSVKDTVITLPGTVVDSFIPYPINFTDTIYRPVYMVKQGTFSATVTPTDKGIRIQGSCDSLQAIINKYRETIKTGSTTSTVVPVTPKWIVFVLGALICLLVILLIKDKLK
jgi:hypothetical protein